MDIGKRMKDLRMLYGLTQQELADRAELTKGFISQLERNQNSPSVGTLLDIIQCLGTTPAEFFSDAAPEQVVFATNDYFEKADSETHSKIEWIVPNAQKNTMEPVRLTLESKGTSPIYQPQDTENFGYVLKGSVRLHLGGKSHTVRSGESFYFKGNSEHFIENPGERTAVLLWVKNPPFF